jgi:transcriptional antiterminator NusG
MAVSTPSREFPVGSYVRVADGPFTDFVGTIVKIDRVQSKVWVAVSIFGRETPVVLDFLQVERL